MAQAGGQVRARCASLDLGGRVRTRCASLDLGGPAPPATMPDTPGEHLPQTPASALIYSNVGE